MTDRIVRYTFTVYCDTPVICEGPDPEVDYTGPELDRRDAIATLRSLLNSRSDFADIDFELMDTETLDC